MRKNLYLQGKASWCRVHTPDKFGNWKITLHPNSPSLEEIRQLQEKGLKNVLSKDDDGEYMTFRRPQQKMIRGKVVGFAPPELLHSDGLTPMKDTIVGNGSDVTVKLEVYTYKPPVGGKEGIAARLASIRVDNLVPFTGTRDFTEEETKMVSGLDTAPKQEDSF